MESNKSTLEIIEALSNNVNSLTTNMTRLGNNLANLVQITSGIGNDMIYLKQENAKLKRMLGAILSGLDIPKKNKDALKKMLKGDPGLFSKADLDDIPFKD